MKRILLACALFVGLFSCKKDSTPHVYNYTQAIDSLHISYNHAYTLFFQRNSGALDSDFIIFHPNGTVSEISNFYDWGSHTFPDTMTYTVNTSFDYAVNWNQIPDALVFTFYPIRDSIRGYRLHDYLNTEIMYLYQSKSYTSSYLTKFLPTQPSDSTAVVTGYMK